MRRLRQAKPVPAVALAMLLVLGGCSNAVPAPSSPVLGTSSPSPTVAPANPEPTPTPLPTLAPADEAARACKVIGLINTALELVDDLEEGGFVLGFMSAAEWERWKQRMDTARSRIAEQVPAEEEASGEWTAAWEAADETTRHFRSMVATWDRGTTIDFPNEDRVAMVVAHQELRDEAQRKGLDCTALAADIPTFGIAVAKARAQETAPVLRELVTAMFDALDSGEPAQVDQAAFDIEEWAAAEVAWANDKGNDCYATEYRSAADSVSKAARRLADPESIPPEHRESILQFTATSLHAAAISVEGLEGGMLDPCS